MCSTSRNVNYYFQGEECMMERRVGTGVNIVFGQ
jgi:hypothetical protein